MFRQSLVVLFVILFCVGFFLLQTESGCVAAAAALNSKAARDISCFLCV